MSEIERVALLEVSQRNNLRDGITGLLYADGRRFLQALEGPNDAVERAFLRIQTDPRHRAVVVLSRRLVDVREFGDWSMAARTPGTGGDAFIRRIADLTQAASPNVRATFQSFAELRRAA